MKMKNLGAIGTILLTSALGGCADDDGGGSDSGSGEATAEWSDYCIAVFNQDVTVEDTFGDEFFTVKNGSQYLISSLTSPFDDGPELLYLTSTGQVSFEADPSTFTTDCTEDNSESVYVAFADTVVYAEETLETELCTISQGESTNSSGTGFSIAGDFSFSGPQTYEISLGGFSEQCGNAIDGYISVDETRIGRTNTYLLPLKTALRPAN
ncbi:MAG: hypothetical protein MK135_17780 [Polyangiaceae bacterium]|nr:hypothetical protein [Polyangiaceae bacterium]